MRLSAGRGDLGAGWSAWKTGGFLAAAESRSETTEIRQKTRCGIHRQLALPRAIYPDGRVALHASTVTSVLEPGRKAPVEPMQHTELPPRRWSLVPLQALGVQSCNRDKTPGKQVQHASACGTAAAEIRHFLAVEPGLTRFRSVFARGFAPVTQSSVSDNVRRTVRSRVRLTDRAFILKQRASDAPDSLS